MHLNFSDPGSRSETHCLAWFDTGVLSNFRGKPKQMPTTPEKQQSGVGFGDFFCVGGAEQSKLRNWSLTLALGTSLVLVDLVKANLGCGHHDGKI